MPEIGATVLTLSNGVEVWLKPTDFKNDQILFSAYAQGGTSLASEKDYKGASLSQALIGVGGMGGLNPVDLSKMLAGKIAQASPSISDYQQSISGTSTPKDLETALQLNYLAITAPNMTPDVTFTYTSPVPNGQIAGVGDINADGKNDILLGTVSGRAYLVVGRADLNVSQPISAELASVGAVAAAPRVSTASQAGNKSTNACTQANGESSTATTLSAPMLVRGAGRLRTRMTSVTTRASSPAPHAIASGAPTRDTNARSD